MRRMYSKKQIEKMAEAIAESVVKNLPSGIIKYGNYIYDDRDVETFKWVEEIPSDYSGIVFQFLDDGLYVTSYVNGVFNSNVYIASNGITVESNSKSALFTADGASKLDFPRFTHSLAELDETLRRLVEDAIADDGTDGVSCTQVQWDAIRSLLDKSLYFNYNGYSMIKSCSDETTFNFGHLGIIGGSSFEIHFDGVGTLTAKYLEV